MKLLMLLGIQFFDHMIGKHLVTAPIPTLPPKMSLDNLTGKIPLGSQAVVKL